MKLIPYSPHPPQPNISGISEYVMGHGKKNIANLIKLKNFTRRLDLFIQLGQV